MIEKRKYKGNRGTVYQGNIICSFVIFSPAFKMEKVNKIVFSPGMFSHSGTGMKQMDD